MKARVFLPGDAYIEIDTGVVLALLDRLPQKHQDTFQAMVQGLLEQFGDCLLSALDLDVGPGSQRRAVKYMVSKMEELVEGVEAIRTSQRG